jgi:aerobic carbon-monoxide dehydrogenase medium subunit
MVVFHRRLPKFEYLVPGTLDEALTSLSLHRGSAMVMAGGTDLIPKLKMRQIEAPEYIIDLKNIPGLDYIKYDAKNGLRLGALVTLRAVETSSLLREKYPLLSQAAEGMASIQVRNRGTVAGNICNAVPSCDMGPSLLCLDARLKLVSRKGERVVKIDDFFTGPSKTVVGDDEILTEIQLPVAAPGCRARYLKQMPRRAMDLPIVGVAAVGIFSDGKYKDARIGLGAVAPRPIRAKLAEDVLRGQKVGQELIERAAEIAAGEARPIDDHRASAEYRRDMVKVLTRRALGQICTLEHR